MRVLIFSSNPHKQQKKHPTDILNWRKDQYLDNGALQTLSVSNNSSSDSQSSSKEAMLPFFLSVILNLQTLAFKRNFPKIPCGLLVLFCDLFQLYYCYSCFFHRATSMDFLWILFVVFLPISCRFFQRTWLCFDWHICIWVISIHFWFYVKTKNMKWFHNYQQPSNDNYEPVVDLDQIFQNL